MTRSSAGATTRRVPLMMAGRRIPSVAEHAFHLMMALEVQPALDAMVPAKALGRSPWRAPMGCRQDRADRRPAASARARRRCRAST
jgi:hypothetical protein